jgi:hypothetical protein
MIMAGETLNYKRDLCVQFGSYCQVHEQEAPRNSMLPRTKKGGICLGPTGNLQGKYRFLSLASNKTIVRHSWTEVPIPDTVIAAVNALGTADDLSLLHGPP